MSIELDRDVVAYSVKVAIRKQMAIWSGARADIAEQFSEMLTEVMFDVAAKSHSTTPETGIIKGLQMVRNWQD